MRAIRVRSAVGVVVIAAALLVGGLAYYLSNSQSRQRTNLENGFAQRAILAAQLTSSALRATIATDPSVLRNEFGGPPSQIGPTLQAASQGDVMAAVLSGSGKVLAVWPRSASGAARQLPSTPDVQRALRGTNSLSDLVRLRANSPPLIRLSQPFDSESGRRVFVDVASARAISFASAYLASAPAIRGGQGYLIDGVGSVLASSSSHQLQGTPLPETGLLAAIARHSSGSLGDSYYAAAQIGAGTHWRVLLVASRSLLLAQVQSSNQVALVLFGAFLLAVLGLLAAGAAVLRSSARLVRARERE
jgi:hypothetical protein